MPVVAAASRVEDAFGRYLAKGRPAHADKSGPGPGEALGLPRFATILARQVSLAPSIAATGPSDPSVGSATLGPGP
ncbi:MAG: hypothetical protein LBP92_07240 [Deltaproteobacteria bacterium]|nr:hypothetical protein [Deltaproteobacteria bacterium]